MSTSRASVAARPAGLTAGLALIIGTILSVAGLESSPEVISAISLLFVGAVSLLAPRSSGLLRPVGITAAVATVLVWVASLAGYTITQELALAVVTVPSLIVSYFTPRVPIPDDLSDDEGNAILGEEQ